MKRYQILGDTCRDRLAEMVEAAMTEGWEPHGGVAVTATAEGAPYQGSGGYWMEGADAWIWYAQALTRETENGGGGPTHE